MGDALRRSSSRQSSSIATCPHHMGATRSSTDARSTHEGKKQSSACNARLTASDAFCCLRAPLQKRLEAHLDTFRRLDRPFSFFRLSLSFHTRTSSPLAGGPPRLESVHEGDLKPPRTLSSLAGAARALFLRLACEGCDDEMTAREGVPTARQGGAGGAAGSDSM